MSASAHLDLGGHTASRLWAPARTALPACTTALARRSMVALVATQTSPATAVVSTRGATVSCLGHLARTGVAPLAPSAGHSYGVAACLDIERILPRASACGHPTARRLRIRACMEAHATTPASLHHCRQEGGLHTSASVQLVSMEFTVRLPSPLNPAISTLARMELRVARTSGGLCACVCQGTRVICAS